jgi:hypothetical protein
MATFESIMKIEEVPSNVTVNNETITTNAIVMGNAIQSICNITDQKIDKDHWRTELNEDIYSIVSNKDGSLIAAVTSTSISILNAHNGSVLMTKHVGVSGKNCVLSYEG